MAKTVKTPSNGGNEFVEHIDMLVGNISANEEIIKTFTEDVDNSILKDKLIDKIVASTNLQTEILQTTGNMLVAITGYLFGEKGINSGTKYNSLITKVKNSAPILGDTPLNKLVDNGSNGKDLNILIELKGINGSDLNALTEVLRVLSSSNDPSSIENIKTITNSIVILKEISEIINSIDFSQFNKTYIKAVDSFNTALCNIVAAFVKVSSNLPNIANKKEILDIIKVFSSVVNEIAVLDLSKLNKSFINSIGVFSTVITNIIDALIHISEQSDSISAQLQNDVLQIFEIISSITESLNNIDFSVFKKSFLNSVENFSIVISSIVDAFADVAYAASGIDKNTRADVLGTIRIITDIVKGLSKIDFSKFNKKFINNISAFSTVIENVSYILQDLETFKNVDNTSVDTVIEVVYNLANGLGKINFSAFDKSFATNIDSFGKSVESVSLINKTLFKNLPVILLINAFSEDIINLPSTLAKFISGTNDNGGLVMVKNILEKNKDLKPKVIAKFFDDTLILFKSVSKLGIISVITFALTKNVEKTAGKLADIIETLSKIDIKTVVKGSKSIQEAAKLVNAMRDIFVGCAICGLVAIPALIGLGVIWLSTKMVFSVIDTVVKGLERIKDLNTLNLQLKEIVIVILTISALLVLAALTGDIVLKNAGNILGFGLVLFAFISLIMATFALFGKRLGDATQNAKEVAILIATCTALMFIGILFMQTGLWVESLKFGAVLTAFMFMILIPFAVFGKFLGNAIESAKEMSILIAVSTLCLFLGAYAMSKYSFWDFILFGVALTAFITLVLLPFIFFKDQLVESLKSVRDIALLVAVCTVVLMAGAWFMTTGLWKESIGFAAILVAFVGLIMLPFIFFARAKNDIAKSVSAIMWLIITCTLILTYGAWFMQDKERWQNAIYFAAIITAFVWLISLPFLLFGKNLRKAAPAMFALVLLVVVSALVLTYGSMWIKEYGWQDALLFTGVLAGFVLAMGVVLKLLSKIKLKNLLIGALAMGLIAGITYLAAKSLQELAEVSKIASAGDLFKTSAIMFGVILGLGILTAAVGALAMPPQGVFFWAGIGAMYAIAGVALVFSKSMKNIAEALVMLKSVEKDGGINTESVMGIISAIPIIGGAVAEAGASLKLNLISKTSFACLSMATMISKIGNAIAQISNLTVGTNWDSKGNAIAFRQLTNKDFVNAAKNTKEIISVLGKAIIELYNENPDMFKAPEFNESSGFLGLKKSVKQGKTPFEIVTRSCSTLGTMITLIAQGVADFADMKIATAWNADGKPTAFRHLKSKDFVQASANISTIISVLGEAVLKLYKDKKHLFEAPLITEKTGFLGLKTKVREGKNPFELVVRSCSSLGSMITMIAQGVRDFATMQIATKWDSNGNPIEYRKLTDTEIKQAIVNIGTIITTLFNALGGVYNDPNLKSIFDAKVEYVNGHLVSNVPIYRVIAAGMLAGKMVSSLAQGVFDVANLRIANKWNDNGVAIGYKQMTEADFANYEVNVKKIINSTFAAINAVYDEHPEYFKTSFVGKILKWDNDSPIQKVIQASQGAGTVISELAKGVSDILNLHIVDENGKHIPINLDDLLPGGKLENVIKGMTSGVLTALASAYTESTDKVTWTKDAIIDIITPAIENLKSLQVVIGEFLKNYKNTEYLNNITSELDNVKSICDKLVYVYDNVGKTTKMKWTRDIITDVIVPTIENLENLQKTINSFNTVAKPENITLITNELGKIKSICDKLTGTYDSVGKTFKMEWTRDIITSVIIPTIENLVNLQKSINSFKVLSNNESIDITTIFTDIQTICTTLDETHTKVGKIENLEWTKDVINNIIIPAVTYAKNLHDIVSSISPTGIATNTTTLTNIISSISSTIIGFTNSFKDFNNGFSIKMLAINNALQNGLIPLVNNFIELQSSLELVNITDNNAYTSLVKSLFEPFDGIKEESIKKFKNGFAPNSARQITEIVKSVNNLSDDKVDKFVELTRELKELSLSVGDISEFINALNGRINETLTNLADKLEDASDTIKQSDKVQEKRQKLIEKNTNKLEKVFKTPMKVEFSKKIESSNVVPSIGTGGEMGNPQSSPSSSRGGSNDIPLLVGAIKELISVLKNK